MADAATISVTATMLPDEIAKTITGSMTVTPADATEMWYYKLTSVTTTSTDLISGSYVNYTAIAVGTGLTAIATGDKVKFLFVQNTSEDDGIMLGFGGETAVYTLANGVFVGPSQTWFGRLPNTTVANLHAISADVGSAGDASASVIVIALLEDISA
jgi:hypothetical protein